MSSIIPRLHAEPSRAHARRWVRRIVLLIGAGFHPDTAPSQYIDPSGKRLLTNRQSQHLQYDLDSASCALGSVVFEAICMQAIHRCLGVRFAPGLEELVPVG